MHHSITFIMSVWNPWGFKQGDGVWGWGWGVGGGVAFDKKWILLGLSQEVGFNNS